MRNSGKAEKVMVPTATEELWMDWKKVVQCTASTTPAACAAAQSFLLPSFRLLFFTREKTSRAAEDQTTRPPAMTAAGASTNCPRTAEKPNSITERCSSRTLLPPRRVGCG